MPTSLETVSSVLFGFEWLYLFLTVGLLLAPWFRFSHRPSPVGVSIGAYAAWRALFYVLLACGIFAFYWLTTVHWYSAHSVDASPGDDDDDETVLSPDVVDPTPHISMGGAPAHLTKSTYVATWILLIASVVLFKLEDLFMCEMHMDSEYFKSKWAFGVTAVLAVLTHIAVTVLFGITTAWSSMGFYIGAAVVYLIGIAVYFIGQDSYYTKGKERAAKVLNHWKDSHNRFRQ